MSDSDFVPEQPGAFRIELSKVNPETKAWLMYRCPCGCGSAGQLALIQPMDAKHDKHTWNWDGNFTTPTLSPSIRRNVECKFHGHFQQGMWTACKDSPPISKKVWRPGMPLPHLVPSMPAFTGTSSAPDPIDVSITVKDSMSPQLQKLVEDMQAHPAETERQILQGERPPPPEFIEPLLNNIERRVTEGELITSPKIYLLFGELPDVAAQYVHDNNIDPALCRFVQRPEDVLGASPNQCEVIVLDGWSLDAKKRQCYAALKRNLLWREYFQQHTELP